MNEDKKSSEKAEPAPQAYEAPAIEETITPDEMEREVHYAGEGSQPTG